MTTSPPRLGKYELLARLATGGMAEIFLARQGGPGNFSRLVVVKRILPHLAERTQFLEMFLEEARLASLINHQNVVQIFDVGQYEESFYIAMEYVDGLSVGALARRARKEGHLVPYPVAGEIVAQALDGLHAAHELKNESGESLNLVHRDVSPQNLMLSRGGETKLVDFGIAKAQGSSIRTRTGAIKGKFPYLSPEQCRGLPLDRRSDLFSLASVFVEILVGQRIFDHTSELMTLKAITEEPIPKVRDLVDDVPETLSVVISRAHEREPEDRYATAAEMAEAVRFALTSTGHENTQDLVARYLETECKELLDARHVSVSQLGQLTAFSSSVPKLDGFDETTSVDETEATRVDRRVSSPPQADQAQQKKRWPIVVGAVLVAIAVGTGLTALVLWMAGGRPSGQPLSFACPPYYDQTSVEKGLTPLARYLETKLDRPVDVRVSKDYDSLVQQLISGEVDFANLSPLLFVQARHRAPEIKVLAAHTYEGARTYQSYLVASVDSKIRAVTDLEGKRFCYVDKSSTSGYLLPRHFFRSKGLDPDTYFSDTRFAGTHAKVMQDILAGRCDAGAIFSGALLSSQELGVPTSRIQLISIAGHTPWDIVGGSPQLPEKTARALKNALLGFDPQRDLGRRFVSATFRIDGFVEPHVEDFAAIEAAARAEKLLDPQ